VAWVFLGARGLRGEPSAAVFHHRPFHSIYRGVYRASPGVPRRPDHRCKVNAAITDQPTIQRPKSRGESGQVADRLRTHRRTRRPTGKATPRRAVPQRLLEGAQLSQLRRLRTDQAVRRRLRATAPTGGRTSLRDHVRGGALVALPSAHHRRSPSRGWRPSLAHSGTFTRRHGAAHPRRDRPSRQLHRLSFPGATAELRSS